MAITNPFNAAAADVERASRGWWVLALGGVISVVAGTIIVFTDWKLSDLAAFIGAVFVIKGIFTMFSIPLDGSSRGWSVVMGLLEVAIGVMVWSWPSPTLLVLAFWLGSYVMFNGIMTIAGAVAGRDVLPYWGFMLAIGVVEVLLSFFLLSRPGLTLVSAVIALGLYCVLVGVAEIVLAFDLHRVTKTVSATVHDLDLTSSSRQSEHAVG